MVVSGLNSAKWTTLLISKSNIFTGSFWRDATHSVLIDFSTLENLLKRRNLPSEDNENILPSKSPVETTNCRLFVEFSIIHAFPADKYAIFPGTSMDANDDLLPIIITSGMAASNTTDLIIFLVTSISSSKTR